jgi:uncharacterized protein
VHIVVADSSPLIGLARIGQIGLVQKLFVRVIVPRKVWAEVTEARADAPGAAEVAAQGWVELVDADEGLVVELRDLVDDGEAEAIAVAKKMPGSVLLVDDQSARRLAMQLNLPIIGTLGILAAAKRAGHLTEVRPHIESLQQIGAYLGDALVQAVLKEIGE